jgi:hypothetical protein
MEKRGPLIYYISSILVLHVVRWELLVRCGREIVDHEWEIEGWELGEKCTFERSNVRSPSVFFWLCPHKLKKGQQQQKIISAFCSRFARTLSFVVMDFACSQHYGFCFSWWDSITWSCLEQEQVPQKFVQSDSICSRFGIDPSFSLSFLFFWLWMFLLNRLFSIARRLSRAWISSLPNSKRWGWGG